MRHGETLGYYIPAQHVYWKTYIVRIIDEDVYNTDGNGVIRIVEREDHLFAEAAGPDGPYIGADAEAAIMPGAEWLDSPNDVIEAWYRTFRDTGQLIRPNSREN